MVFHRSPRECKSPQFSWTLFSILADLNMPVVSIHPLIPSSPRLLFKPLEYVPRMLFTIGITAILSLHTFLSSLARSK